MAMQVGWLAALQIAAWASVAVADCSAVVEVDVHGPAPGISEIQEKIAVRSFTGQYRVCEAEQLSFSHAASAYKGYTGCVGETGLTPCPQDGYEGLLGQTALRKPYVFNETTGTCEASGYSLSSTTLWMMWGQPQDTHELVKKTGTNPAVIFPLQRMTYARIQDWEDAKAKMKEFQKYVGAFTEDHLASFEVTLTEGAESGMVALYAAMAVKMAKMSCNRHFYIFVEAPAYGYTLWRSAELAEEQAGHFKKDGGCMDATDKITFEVVGWVEGTALPVRMGADGANYTVDSTDLNSPWLESMVYPENPTGKRRMPKGPTSRLLCDGAHLLPIYLPDSFTNAELPDCAGWSFSVTKLYSAAVRAGHLLYKANDATWVESVQQVMDTVHHGADGLYSEWSWMGQMQIYDFMMQQSPVSGWIGSYKTLMSDKWWNIDDGFNGCPVVELTNAYDGAYAYFKLKEEFKGLDEGQSTSTFMMDCLGIKTSTYYWAWRGADPAEVHGAGYSSYDFIRLPLFRDISVIREVRRRAQIVCAGGKLDDEPGRMTYGEWKAMRQTEIANAAAGDARRLAAENLLAAVPRVARADAKMILAQHEKLQEQHKEVEQKCAPHYDQGCLYTVMGNAAEGAAA